VSIFSARILSFLSKMRPLSDFIGSILSEFDFDLSR